MKVLDNRGEKLPYAKKHFKLKKTALIWNYAVFFGLRKRRKKDGSLVKVMVVPVFSRNKSSNKILEKTWRRAQKIGYDDVNIHNLNRLHRGIIRHIQIKIASG